MNEIVLEIRKTAAEFSSLRDAWNELSEHSVYPNLFTTWDWQFCWWKWFGDKPGNELMIFVVRGGDRLIGILPFYRINGRLSLFKGRRHLQWIGYGGRTCPEYLGPIIRKGFVEETVAAIVRFLKTHPAEWDSIFFEDYALDDPGTTCLAERLHREFVSYRGDGESRYVLPLPEDYETYLKSLGSHNRKGKRSRMNQAKKHHGAYAVFQTADQMDHWFPVVVSLTTESRIRRNQPSPFLDDVYAGFHRELLQRLLPQQRAAVQFLFFSDEPVACWYVFLLDGKCYAYQQGSRSDVKGSPGDVGTLFLLDNLMQRGCAELDFLRGLEWYKTTYTDQMRATAWMCVYRKRGLAWQSRLLLDRLIKPVYRRLRDMFKRSGKSTDPASGNIGKSEQEPMT